MNIRPDLKMTKNRYILSINYTHYGPLFKKIYIYITCMINLMHSIINIVTIARIASGCDVKSGGAQSLQKKIIGYA